jgi:hypothetical protein
MRDLARQGHGARGRIRRTECHSRMIDRLMTAHHSSRPSVWSARQHTRENPTIIPPVTTTNPQVTSGFGASLRWRIVASDSSAIRYRNGWAERRAAAGANRSHQFQREKRSCRLMLLEPPRRMGGLCKDAWIFRKSWRCRRALWPCSPLVTPAQSRMISRAEKRVPKQSQP